MMTDKNKLDDIYSLLDEVTKDEGNYEEKEASDREEKKVSLAGIGKSVGAARLVKKPSLPSVYDYDNRSDCFMQLLSRVDYGNNNAKDYVEGHRDALSKYLLKAKENPRNLYLAEGQVDDEIGKYARANKNSLYVKGYYDGLVYVYKALKRSKELISEKMYEKLKREIGK